MMNAKKSMIKRGFLSTSVKLSALIPLFAALSACQSAGGGKDMGSMLGAGANVLQGAGTALGDFGPDKQAQAGADMSAVILGARPLLRNEGVQRYVNQVGQWVAQGADASIFKDKKAFDIKWRFGVIDSEGVNAYAAPGGYIFVTKGLLKRLRSEAELAAVLGHEIGHVTAQHYVPAIRKAGLGQAVSGAATLAAKNSGQEALVNIVKNIVLNPLDKNDEFQADRIGAVLAARAGYAPMGMMGVLGMLAAEAPKDAVNFEIIAGSHPPPNDRMDALDKAVGSSFDRIPGIKNEMRYRAVMSSLR